MGNGGKSICFYLSRQFREYCCKNMGSALTEQLIKKLGLGSEPRLTEKAVEILRLLELKSSKIVSTVGNYGKTAICIDLASSELGIPFDISDGVKVSGLRKAVYTNYKRVVEKVLGLNKPVGIDEICVRLGLSDVVKRASEILNLFKDSLGEDPREIDLSHPQYAAIAVYQACKLDKRKISRQKLIAFSHLKPAQWTKLEQSWDKFIAEKYLRVAGQKRKTTEGEERPKKFKQDGEKITNQKFKDKNEVEDYETWKNRMLLYAREGLGKVDKENQS